MRHDVGKTFVEIFDCTLANWMGVLPGICAYSKECGHAGVMEHNGDVYSCDHFVFPEYKLGNIREQSLIDMLYGEKQQAVRQHQPRMQLFLQLFPQRAQRLRQQTKSQAVQQP